MAHVVTAVQPCSRSCKPQSLTSYHRLPCAYKPGCADAVDVGETSYTMVLADDLNADGKLDLLVTTMNGNVYVFSSPASYHPLKSWTSQVRRPFGLHLDPQRCRGLAKRSAIGCAAQSTHA